MLQQLFSSFDQLSFSSPLVILTLFLTPVLVLAGLIVALAAVGTSLGLRKMYVKALLKVFEVSWRILTPPLESVFILRSDSQVRLELIHYLL